MLDLDTLRPDHMGCYGYCRNTSPHIDSIAAEGVRFTNWFCADAPCLPSRAGLMTGRFGLHSGVVGHGGTAADLRIDGADRGFHGSHFPECFPTIFRRSGFRTVSVSPFAERHSAWWFYAGFNETYNTGKCGMESAEEITPKVLKWIDANAREDNWFVHVNYWDPHTPYRASAQFGNPFEHDPLPAWITPEVFERHRAHVGPHSAREISMYNADTSPDYPRHPGEILDMHGLRRLIDGYDCGIRYMDDHIGTVLAALEKQGVSDDLAIIVTADHGENLGELGIYAEHATADYATCHIPMIIRWPGAARGHVDSGLHYNIDLAPTMAELLGCPAAARWDGRSCAASVLCREETRREYLVLSQCAHVCQRSVLRWPWLYMRTYHDGFHLFPDEMLFDLERDPYEDQDLAADHPETLEAARRTLADWREGLLRTSGHGDPLDTVLEEGGPFHAKGRLREYCQRLEQTGRGWAVPELRRRHPHEFEPETQ